MPSAPGWVAPVATTPVAPTPAEPLALLGTFLLGWGFLSFTAHVAASYVLTDPPWHRAVVVGAAAAAVSTALIRFHPAIVVGVGLLVDAAAVHLVYEPRPRTTAILVAVHYAASIALALALSLLIGLFATAPG